MVIHTASELPSVIAAVPSSLVDASPDASPSPSPGPSPEFFPCPNPNLDPHQASLESEGGVDLIIAPSFMGDESGYERLVQHALQKHVVYALRHILLVGTQKVEQTAVEMVANYTSGALSSTTQ